MIVASADSLTIWFTTVTMAINLGGNNKRSDYERFFSKCRKKIGSEFTHKPKCNSNYEWTWKYSILATLIKNHRQSRVSMRARHTNSRPFDISVRKVKERKSNAEEQCTEGRQLVNQ
jgi:hypothetical protein